LEVLGYRDREKDIFTMMREIFKTKNLNAIRESVRHIDADPNLLILWLNENLPREYIDRHDLVNGYDALSKADIFIGRTFKCQDYCLWSYASDIMNGGVATAKTHSYPNDSYNFPIWLRQRKDVKSNLDSKDSVIMKLSNATGNSKNKTKDLFLPYFRNMFRNDTFFAIKMRDKFGLSENEIEFLLGKSHSFKLKEILNADIEKIKPIEQSVEKEKNKEKEMQQSLFDF
jgi:replication factor C large subunit